MEKIVIHDCPELMDAVERLGLLPLLAGTVPGYSADELVEIFMMYVKKNQYTLDDDAKAYLKERLEYAVEHKDRNFGNARYARNQFEKVIQAQANRVAQLKNASTKDLTEITMEDMKSMSNR